MRKKCFKKAVSLALCIIMSVTMTGTPVLADTFTDGSQSIISENAEIPIVDAESATNCGDVASTGENLTEPALLREEEFDNPEYVEFSGGNDAEAVSEFSDVRLKLKGSRFFKTVIYLPNLIMASAFSMLFFTLFSDGGPINSLLMQIGFISEPYKFLSHAGSARGLIAMMNCLMWFGNTTILLMAGMMGIDTSLFEAAEVDGATSTQVFFKITLPLLRPILVYVIITSLIGGLQLFDVPQILTNGTGDPMRSTMTLIMYLNKHLFSKNYGMAGALSVVLFILTTILSLIVFKVTGNDKRKG